MFLNNYLKNSRAKNKYCVETAVAIICLIALTSSSIKMDRRCALKLRGETINQSNGREFGLPYIGQCMPKDLSPSMYSIF